MERGLSGDVRLSATEPAAPGTSLLTRTHPLAAVLGEALVEAALDPEALPGLGLGRVGAWPTAAVARRATLALLRLRMTLTVHARAARLILAEEASLVALEEGRVVATGEAARALLAAPALGDLAPIARDRFLQQPRAALPGLLDGPLRAHAEDRARELVADHERLRAAAGAVSRVSVAPALPPDVIGLFVLLPAQGA